MGVLADWQIRERLNLPRGASGRLVIDPFADTTKEPGKVSWGLSHYGYDMRLGRKFLIFTDTAAVEVDPLNFRPERFVRYEGDSCLVPPNSFVLAESLEYFEIPADCICVVSGKSTYARCGIGLTMTALEPGWKGVVTIEIANHTRLPARVWSEQGIGQVLFLKGDAACERTYADKLHAMYQDQPGLTLPRV
jgi:dCTP deaminase